ncbi:uncharacterized protein LOC110033301 [Phalaenopsis equestris]|uniref:uncharacterized protein LOC110033301 n=1 Tax=Phalaenopsis equestris TaxID=78828 RepID=UPI0009E36318|nr:uncharacterized protein LOC110033301 [Phalaenopsis equestris]
MPFNWLKFLHCKCDTLGDVVHLPNNRPPSSSSNRSLSSRSSSHALFDVIFLRHKIPHFCTKQLRQLRSQTIPLIPNSNLSPKQKPTLYYKTPAILRPPPPSASWPPQTLSLLPAAHSSRRIIELIFRSGWFPSNAPFSGQIEMLFRIRHSPTAIAAFEALRSAIIRVDSGDPRCAADGNEMMRFHAPGSDSGLYNGGLKRSRVGKMEGVRTFEGSRGAHESCSCGDGRKRMLVCRVIVGRVGEPEEMGSGVDSVRYGEEEILVLDDRAVHPCFLIIYRV